MNTRPQRGFALMVVLMLVAMGVILGLSYLSSASLHVGIARNYRAVSRARYLAESGLAHGLYLLRFDPASLDGSDYHPLGPFYADDTSDGYTISCRNEGDGRYTLYCDAAVGGIRRRSSAAAERWSAPRLENKRGVLVGTLLSWMPPSVTVTGDVHVNGLLINFSRIQGNASATWVILDPFGRITGTIREGVPAVPSPPIRVDQYVTYYLEGANRSAVRFEGSELTSTDPLAGSGAISPANPGGVIQLAPKVGNTVTIRNNVQLTGTLVIDGDLVIDGRDITISAVRGFPAIVTTGRVVLTDQARNVTINGLVAADWGVGGASLETNHSSTTINGGLASKILGYGPALSGDHHINYQKDRAQVFDFSLPPEKRLPQVTVVQWND